MLGSWRQTVRPRSARRMPVPLCLLVFCLTAIVVYGWGKEIWIPSTGKAKQTATAYVVERAKAGQSDLRIPMAATDDDLRRAEAAANARADDYVKDRRADWQRRTARTCHDTRQAVEQAQREHAQNEDRLEAFRRQLAGATTPQTTSPLQQKSSPRQAMIDNPKWVDLNGRLSKLQRRRESLLIDRTPAHPAVEDVTVQIKDLQRQIATIPRQIASATSAKPEIPATPLLENDSITSQDAKKLDGLKAAVESARLAFQQAAAAEKQARDAQNAGPQYSLVYARAAEISPTPDYGWQRLMYTTLVAVAC